MRLRDKFRPEHHPRYCFIWQILPPSTLLFVGSRATMRKALAMPDSPLAFHLSLKVSFSPATWSTGHMASISAKTI